MSQIGARILHPFVKRYALSFLREERIEEKQERLLKDKFRKVSGTKIGRELGITRDTLIEKAPLTSYGFYRGFFEAPNEGNFIYPLNEYVKVFTSGTMSRPKVFLLPKPGIWDNLRKTGLSFMFISTHDGERITYEVGDVVYRNLPGGSYISGYLMGTFQRRNSGWVVQVPDSDLPFQEKVDYFVENYREIDVAYMTVTTLLDDVYPRIGEPFHLKGFITQDRSAGVFKERIREITGNYPKVTYGSTETMFSGLPSIEHPGSFFFDWRVLHCEFLPEDEAIDFSQARVEEPPETLPMMDLEAGERYQLVATPFRNDLTRYITTDILECVSKGDGVLGTEMPVFDFYARGDRLVTLHNFTRVSEEEILHVLKEAGIPFVDFTARSELVEAKEYMAIYLELSEEMGAEEVTGRLHGELYGFDKDYRDLTDFFGYLPLRVRLLPRGAFRRYMGSKGGIPRVERIGMREERLSELLRIGEGGSPIGEL